MEVKLLMLLILSCYLSYLYTTYWRHIKIIGILLASHWTCGTNQCLTKQCFYYFETDVCSSVGFKTIGFHLHAIKIKESKKPIELIG